MLALKVKINLVNEHNENRPILIIDLIYSLVFQVKVEEKWELDCGYKWT